jgi:hypothetical protein
MKEFLGEVFRLLRPNGYFLFADFRSRNAIDSLRGDLANGGFAILKEERITPSILKAMELEEERKLNVMGQLIPKFFHNDAHNMFAISGSKTHEAFRTGKLEYLCFVLRKS